MSLKSDITPNCPSFLSMAQNREYTYYLGLLVCKTNLKQDRNKTTILAKHIFLSKSRNDCVVLVKSLKSYAVSQMCNCANDGYFIFSWNRKQAILSIKYFIRSIKLINCQAEPPYQTNGVYYVGNIGLIYVAFSA